MCVCVCLIFMTFQKKITKKNNEHIIDNLARKICDKKKQKYFVSIQIYLNLIETLHITQTGERERERELVR